MTVILFVLDSYNTNVHAPQLNLGQNRCISVSAEKPGKCCQLSKTATMEYTTKQHKCTPSILEKFFSSILGVHLCCVTADCESSSGFHSRIFCWAKFKVSSICKN